jgi:hypothetical protein
MHYNINVVNRNCESYKDKGTVIVIKQKYFSKIILKSIEIYI